MQEFGWRYWLISGLSWSFLYFGLGLSSGVSGALGVLSGSIVYWLDAYLLRSSRKNVIDDNFQIATVHGFKVLHRDLSIRPIFQFDITAFEAGFQ